MKNKIMYVSLVILVQKRDKSLKLCIDYRGLNKITIKKKIPIAFINEMLNEIHRVKYFSQLDPTSKHYKSNLKLEGISKTMLKTYEGHYEFNI
jgi:hypothetical protein